MKSNLPYTFMFRFFYRSASMELHNGNSKCSKKRKRILVSIINILTTACMDIAARNPSCEICIHLVIRKQSFAWKKTFKMYEHQVFYLKLSILYFVILVLYTYYLGNKCAVNLVDNTCLLENYTINIAYVNI